MSDTGHQSPDIELHGYLDGELSDQRVGDIEAYLDQSEEDSERLIHYGVQGDLIRRLYAPLLNRPIPLPMLSQLSANAQPRRRYLPSLSNSILIAGLLLTLTAFAATVWLLGLSLNDVMVAIDKLSV